jgi:spoIIIJ-associated protein
MRTVEVEGNSRVDATRRALELLGADIDDVKVEVIREEPRGLLGFLGFKRVTVRVTLVEENILDRAGEIVKKLVSFLPVPVEAGVRMHKHNIHLDLAGHELRQFQQQEDVADAIGHVLELIVNRHAKNKITVKAAFVEGKTSREDELRKLARSTADRVAARGREEALPAMSPRDRRTVHMTLENDDRVVTESAGKGNKRHVVIFPAKGRKKAEKQAEGKPGDGKQGDRKRGDRKPKGDRARPPAGTQSEKKSRSSRRRRRRPRSGGKGERSSGQGDRPAGKDNRSGGQDKPKPPSGN